MLICCRKCKIDIDDTVEQPLKCSQCNFYYHFPRCCDTFKLCPYSLLVGDTFYHYVCDGCADEEEKGKQLHRLHVGWADIDKLMRRNITVNDVVAFIRPHWHRFFANEAPDWDEAFKTQVLTWIQEKSATKAQGYEGIVTSDGSLLPLPSSKIFKSKPLRSRTKSREEIPKEDVEEDVDGEAEQLGFKSSKALKKSLKKLASTFTFSNLDFDRPNPDYPVTISKAPTHSAQQLQIDDLTVSNQLGYALARTTHGFDSGSWYFEVKFGDDSCEESHIRLGVAQILAEAQAPVGYDEYSYGIRDKDGAVMHCGRENTYANRFGPGDVVGVMLRLPSDPSTAAVDEALRKSIETTYPPKGLGAYKVRQEILSDATNSSLTFSINGRAFGPAFTNIYKAKYYPAVSLFGGAKATFNFGPEFVHACPEGYKPAYLIHDKSQ